MYLDKNQGFRNFNKTSGAMWGTVQDMVQKDGEVPLCQNMVCALSSSFLPVFRSAQLSYNPAEVPKQTEGRS